MVQKISPIILLVAFFIFSVMHLTAQDNSPHSNQDIQAGQIISLNGMWNFKADYYGKGETQQWFSSSFNDAGWDRLAVPGNWDIRNEYADFSGKGWYRTVFNSPAGIAGKSVRLNFEAVGIAYKVWLNGVLIGDISGGFLSNDFDVTKLLKEGFKNSLVVCADNSFRSGAYWSWGGIRRPVTLLVDDPMHIESVKITATPDLKKGTAAISFNAAFSNGNQVNEVVDLVYELSSKGKLIKIGSQKITFVNSNIKTAKINFSLAAKDVQLWHFDFPNLYNLKVQIKKGSTIVHEINDRFGIRKVEITGGRFLLNGESVRAMGLNWVADDRLTGNTLQPEVFKRDIDNMKALGVNITRLSHMPLPKDVYDYLDEKGILVIAEIPLWGTTKLTDPDNPIARQWMRQLVNNHFNHPAIIGWCVGNEIGDKSKNTKVMEYGEKAIQFVKDSLDNSRLVVLVSHTANHQKEDPSQFGDFVPYNTYGAWGKNVASVHNNQPGKLIFISECGGNLIGEDINTSTGNFPEMFNELRNLEYCFGASLWTYNDYRSDYRTSNLSWDSKISQNRDWGVVDVYGNKKRAFEIIRKEFSPFRSLTVKNNNNSTEVNLQPRNRLDLPAYTLKEYKLVCEDIGKEGQSLKRSAITIQTVNPGDPAFTKSFAQEVSNQAIAARKISLVSPTSYTLMDTTIYYTVPQVPVIKAVFNNGNKIRVVFDHVNFASEYKLLYGESELNISTVNTIDNYIETAKLPAIGNIGKVYQVQLVAINHFGESKSVIHKEAITNYGKLPPVIKGVTVFQNGISLGYSSEKGEYRYEVQYSTSPGFSSDTHIMQVKNKGACYIPDLKQGLTYYVRMCVFEQYEVQSEWSETYEVKL